MLTREYHSVDIQFYNGDTVIATGWMDNSVQKSDDFGRGKFHPRFI